MEQPRETVSRLYITLTLFKGFKLALYCLETCILKMLMKLLSLSIKFHRAYGRLYWAWSSPITCLKDGAQTNLFPILLLTSEPQKTKKKLNLAPFCLKGLTWNMNIYKKSDHECLYVGKQI